MKYQECLRSLGVEEECIQAFRDNEIDDDSVLLLGEAELKELIPKIGPRMKFKKLIQEVFHKEQDLTLIADTSKTNEDTDVCKLTLCETSGSETSDIDKLAEKSAQRNENSESLDGRALIKEGQAGGGLLREGSRRKLSQLIINHSIENKTNWKISTEDFYKLASEIVALFPRESLVVYYSPYHSDKNCNSAKKNASGKLYESYINRRRKLRQSGELAGTHRQHSSASSSRSTSVTSDINNQPDYYDDNISFLKSNVEPWRKVVECWSATCTHRLTKLYDGKQGGIKLEYPALKQPEGYTLLMNDFNELFPENENRLFSSIEIHKENIVNYAKRKADCSRDRNLKTNIQRLIELTANESEPESITNVCLALLPYIINISPARKKKGRDIIKFSRSEITSAFIHQVASEADVTPSIIERREMLAKQQRSMQPYIIYVGEYCTKIRASYVVINDTVYSFSKLITAVDCAFKIFHATGACYPEECEDVWLFIQLGFFKIHTKYDRNTQVVNSLMSDLGLI